MTVEGTIRTAHSPVIPASRLLAKAKPFALAAGAMLASACGPVIDAMPYSVRDEIPYALDSALRHPIDFAACAVSPTCDALAPPVVLGGI
jgi:hypothetical protein